MKKDVITKPTLMASLLLEQYVKPGDRVVDATAGNGHDTALLLELVGRKGKVYSFDIQQKALDQTAELLAEQGEPCDGSGAVELILDSHSRMKDHVKEPVQAVVFNLGYLPGGDKSVITKGEETLAALDAAFQLLKAGGAVVITVYSGHDQAKEKQAVLDYCRQLDPKRFHSVYMSLVNQPGYPPEVVAIVKK